jgi:hypothetical protein
VRRRSALAQPSTTIGNLESPWRPVVGRRGLLTPRPGAGAWSLDWWIGAEDRWHVPATEAQARVRQRLIGAAPVVETAVRVPGGEAVHRAFAVRAPDELVVIEIENCSRVPFAVALAVRSDKRVVQRDDTTVTVGRKPALLLPRRPAQVAGSEGELAVLVFPLAHTATLRVAVPLDDVRQEVSLGALPSAEQVANGWSLHSRGAMQVVLPDARLQEAFEANRRYLLLFDVDRAPRKSSVGLDELLLTASPTWTWGDGHDERIAASFVSLVRDSLVRDHKGSLELLGVVPDSWLGQGVEVHDAPTRHGVLSYAVRWHGARPALLWELDGARRGVTITAPGLDPEWSTTEASGEALLSAVEPPGGLPKVYGPPPETDGGRVPDAGESFR